MPVARLLPLSRPRMQRLAPGATLFFLLAVLVSSSSPQSVPGYSNVSFTVQPQDTYVITENAAMFSCTAEGQAEDTGNTESLDIIVYFNNQAFDKHTFVPRMFVNQEGQKVAGLTIFPTLLQDNNASIYCMVEASDGDGLFSQTAKLIVDDGKPPAVVPSQVHQGLYDIEVTWEPLVVPLEGPVLSYTADLMGPVELHDELENNVTSLLLEGLLPSEEYTLTVVASNQFGKGNVTSVIVTTRNPVAPSPPESISVDVLPASSALVSWSAVVIDNETMTPVIYYNVAYFPVDSPSLVLSKNTTNASELQMMIYNLTLGLVYEIRVSAVNSAGQGQPVNKTVMIALPVSTPYVPEATPTPSTPTPSLSSVYVSSPLSHMISSLDTSVTLTVSSSTSATTMATTTSATTSILVIAPSSSLAAPSESSALPLSEPSSTSTSSSFAFSSVSSSSSMSSSSFIKTSSSVTLSSVILPLPSSSSSTSISVTSSTHSSAITTITNHLPSPSITYPVSPSPSTSSVMPPRDSSSYSTTTTDAHAPSPSSEIVGTESTDSSTTSPSGSRLLLIIVPAVIASLIVVAIVVIAIMIIVMCLLSMRKDSSDFIDGEISQSDWESQRHSTRKRKEKEHEASIKESFSAATNRSSGSSDSSEMPTLAIHPTGCSAINGTYLGSIPDDDDDGTTV